VSDNLTGKRELAAIAFGKVLRKYRRRVGLSQEELAHRSDMDRTYPSLMERGLRTPTITIIFQIGRGLGITPSVLVKEAEDIYKRLRQAR